MTTLHNPERLKALAELLDALRREQTEQGFQIFCLGSEDRISMSDAEQIVLALRRAAVPGEKG